MKKTAMDLFRWIQEEEREVGEEGAAPEGAAPEGAAQEGAAPRGRARGQAPASTGKKVRRPVRTLEDLKASDPILARTIGLPRYQAKIQELQDKARQSTAGIVNFVIGTETVIADAILKAAFPPGSGIVYKGVDGYKLDASQWPPERAVPMLVNLLKGNPRMLSLEDLKSMREKLKDAQDLMITFEGGSAGGPPPTPVVAPPSGRRGQPQAQSPAPGAQGTTPLERAIMAYEELLRQWAKSESIMKTINRDEDPMWFKQLVTLQRKLIAQMNAVRDNLERYVDVFGQTDDYDKTGFLDFSYDIKVLSRALQPLSNPQNLENTLLKGGLTKEQINDEVKLQAYKSAINAALKVLNDLAGDMATINAVGGGQLRPAIQDLINFLSRDPSVVMTDPSKVVSKSKKIFALLSSASKVMILNNVDESGLVIKPHPGSADQNYHWAYNPVFGNEYINRKERKDRSIILVSREPVKFKFTGVEYCSLAMSKVDDDEAKALFEYYRDTFRIMFQKKSLPMANIRINGGDANKILMALQGKDQEEAKTILNKAFASAHDKKAGIIDGEKLWRTAVEESNTLVAAATSGPGRDGNMRGCYAMKPKETAMERYIRDPSTEWGQYVDRINSRLDRAADKMALQDEMRAKLYEVVDDKNMAPAEKLRKSTELEAMIDKLDKDAKSNLCGIPHFLVLHGLPGCGKSQYVEAFASKAKFNLKDANFGQTRGSLVGQTEQWSHALIHSWEKLANCVIRLDEIDGMVANSEQEARESYNASVVKDLLSFLQDKQAILEQRNVFIMATTNNPHLLRGALKSRAKAFMEVPLPTTKDGYGNWLVHAIENIRSERSIAPIYDPDPNSMKVNTYEDRWKATEELMGTIKGDHEKLAAELVNTGMDFRALANWFQEAWDAHMAYLDSTRQLHLFEANPAEFERENKSQVVHDANGQKRLIKPKIFGFPFTAENLIEAAKLTRPLNAQGQEITLAQRHAGEQSRSSDGINLLATKLFKAYNKDVSEEIESGQMSFMSSLGKPPTAEDEPDLLTPADPGTLASTDYYLQQLVKSGIITKGGRVGTKAQAAPLPPVPKKDKEPILFNFGTLAMMPIQVGQRDVMKISIPTGKSAPTR